MKVIAFGVWNGTAKPRYRVGVIRNAELTPQVYPGWQCWVYHPAGERCEPLEAMPHVRLIPLREPADWRASFWRFAAAGDEAVEAMISRDADSRLAGRERAAVDEWLDSGRSFHIMRDHPFHTDPMLAGMWGVRSRPALREVAARLARWPREDYYGTDQAFLAAEIYPLALADGLIHDDFPRGGRPEPGARRFPGARRGLEFVGQQFDEDGWPVFAHSVSLAGALWRGEVTAGGRGISENAPLFPK